MTDPRPAENTDDYPKFPTMVGMFGARHAETPTVDHKAEAEEILANRGSMNDPNGLALAHAVMYLAEQQQVANKLAVAHIDAITDSIRIRDYLTADEWKELGL